MIQITAGKGPTECYWVVAKVLKMFLKELKALKLEFIIIDQEKGPINGTVQSVAVAIQISGKDTEAFLKNWVGTIQWIGTSMYRKYNKRKNWFVGIFEITQQKSLELKDSEIQYQAIRSSGPGGQHVNKVSSAIRATHIVSGIQVVVMDTRSQHQNRKLARQRLEAKVTKMNIERLKTLAKDLWENHQELERGNPIKVFKGTDFKHKKENKKYKQQRQNLKNDLRNELN